jgi:tetratricopeptide (TPR) repeat protein
MPRRVSAIHRLAHPGGSEEPLAIGQAGREPDSTWWLAAILVAVAIAYANALAAGFQFDDFNIIVDNPAVHSLAAWWADMPGIRPLLKLSYTLNWLADPGPLGFHAVNVLLHLLNVALVWRLTAYLPVRAGWEHGPERIRARVLATLLFALHPIQTESVTYISGRSMSLMAAFGLAGLLCWLEAPTRTRPRLWRGLALVLFAAALASKEVAVVLPLALLLLYLHDDQDRRSTLKLMRVVGLFLAALVTLLFWLGYGYLLTTPMHRGLAANLASEIHALFYLLGQLFQPHALNIDPDLPEYPGWALLPALEAAALIALLSYAWAARRRHPSLFFGLAWWLLLLLPTHSLIPRADLASERHFYLAALGLYWMIAVALASLPALRPAPRWIGMVAGLALLGMLFTTQRNADYRDEISLWRATATRSPHKARVWNNLGYAHALAGQTEPARAAFRETLRLDPKHARAARNLNALDAGYFSRRQAIPHPTDRRPP